MLKTIRLTKNPKLDGSGGLLYDPFERQVDQSSSFRWAPLAQCNKMYLALRLADIFLDGYGFEYDDSAIPKDLIRSLSSSLFLIASVTGRSPLDVYDWLKEENLSEPYDLILKIRNDDSAQEFIQTLNSMEEAVQHMVFANTEHMLRSFSLLALSRTTSSHLLSDIFTETDTIIIDTRNSNHFQVRFLLRALILKITDYHPDVILDLAGIDSIFYAKDLESNLPLLTIQNIREVGNA